MKRQLIAAAVLIFAAIYAVRAENEAAPANDKAPQQYTVTFATVWDYVPRMRIAETKSMKIINGTIAFETHNGFLAYLQKKAPKGSTVILPAGSRPEEMNGDYAQMRSVVNPEIHKNFKQFCDELGLKIEIAKE